MGSPLLAAATGYDPMRRIVAGLRASAQPGTIQQRGHELDFYGQGDPFDIAVAEEQRRTERARADQRQVMSDASWVDPRIERDDPTQAAKIRAAGAAIGERMRPIEDGPLTQLLNGSQGSARVLPMVRGAERVENIADANAEATNYGSAPQVAMRGVKRSEGLLDAQQAANTFMDPQVATARKAGQQEQTDAALAAGRDPRTQGFDLLRAYLAQLAGNPYPSTEVPGFRELSKLLGIQMDESAVPQADGGTRPVQGANIAPGAKSISRRQIAAEAAAEQVSPSDAEAAYRADGYVITP